MRLSGWALVPWPWDGAKWITSARCRTLCPLHCTTSGGKLHLVEGRMVHERSTTRSEFSVSGKSHTPPRMVMPSMTGVHRPYQEWWCFWYHGLHWPRWQMGRTRWQSVTALSGRWVCMALCVLPIYPHRIILLFLARFGFGFHLCLHILGCFDTCWTITEAPSRCILLFDWTGWPQLPWHWCNPKRSSNILPDGTFLILFSWIQSGDSIIWLHGWALLPLPCYGASDLPICWVPHALMCTAGWAIQLREHPGDHSWWHIEVPVGVPSVSTECLGLLRMLHAPPTWCTIEVAALLAFIEESEIQGWTWAP